METKNEKTKTPEKPNTNYCVACGTEIPEGDMLCKACKEKIETIA